MTFSTLERAEQYLVEMLKEHFNDGWVGRVELGYMSEYWVEFTRSILSVRQDADGTWDAYCDPDETDYSPTANGKTPEAAVLALKEKMKNFALRAQQAYEEVVW